MKKILVVGTGRSGTGYVSQVFRHCGLTFGHESVFTPYVANGLDPLNWYDYQGDSSWLAVPLLPRLSRDNVLVVHVVRDVMKTCESLTRIRFFEDGRFDAFINTVANHTPQTLNEVTQESRAVAHWLRWNHEASLFADLTFHLESLDAESFQTMLDVAGVESPVCPEEAIRQVPSNYNNKDEMKTGSQFDWDRVRLGLKKACSPGRGCDPTNFDDAALSVGASGGTV